MLCIFIYNIVLQKAISCSKGQQFNKFMTYLAPLMDKLKYAPFGTKLHSKLLNNYPDLKKIKKTNKLISNNNI